MDFVTNTVPVDVHQIPTSSNSHPMGTRSKVGVYKPKAYTATISFVEPSNIHEAMAIPSYHKIVDDELQALIQNNKWDLVLAPSDRLLVG